MPDAIPAAAGAPNPHLAPYEARGLKGRILSGVQPPSPVGERLSQAFTIIYFGFFLFMPWWSQMGKFKPVPNRVTFSAH